MILMEMPNHKGQDSRSKISAHSHTTSQSNALVLNILENNFNLKICENIHPTFLIDMSKPGPLYQIPANTVESSLIWPLKIDWKTMSTLHTNKEIPLDLKGLSSSDCLPGSVYWLRNKHAEIL